MNHYDACSKNSFACVFPVGFLKPQCSMPPQRGRAEACTCFSGMCALHQRRLSTGNLCILRTAQSLMLSTVHKLSAIFSATCLLAAVCLHHKIILPFCVRQLFPWNLMVLTLKNAKDTWINQCIEVIFRALNGFPLYSAITHAKYVWSCNMSAFARNKTHLAWTYKHTL